MTVQNTGGLNLEYEDLIKLIGSNPQDSKSKSAAKFRDVRDYVMYINSEKYSGDV